MKLNEITHEIIRAAMTVHSYLGPGLLENVYQICMESELRQVGLDFASQVSMPINYKGLLLDSAYRMDFLVAGEVVVELKAVEKLLPIHEAQLFTYLKLSGKKIGLIINFNSLHLKDGIKRMVNNLPESEDLPIP